MSWFSRTPAHVHKWLDLSRTNTKLPVRKTTWSWQGEVEEESVYVIERDVPHICILQKCESCGDVRTLNLEGAISEAVTLAPEIKIALETSR